MDTTHDPGQPSTADVLAEVERRRVESRRPMSKRERRFVVAADRFVFWLSKHWLAVFNSFAFLYVGLPALAPVLMALGIEGPAQVIYTVYSRLCNQLPQRSWFFFGPQLSYTVEELSEWIGTDALAGAWAHGFVGNEAIGFKCAHCQRCTAIYGAIFLFGVLYGLSHRRIKSLPIWAYVVFGLLPMAFDGGYQFMTYLLAFLIPNVGVLPHETTPLMRVITGTLFGLCTVWLAYPLVQESMNEVRESLHKRFGWE
jgi:uncharacterized membrane protein